MEAFRFCYLRTDFIRDQKAVAATANNNNNGIKIREWNASRRYIFNESKTSSS